MPVALFVSPHLDDVVFSCGGLAAMLADRGWHTVLATVFTRSVVPAQGFALACQLDKGLPPELDYMALRRAEDLRAAAIIPFAAVHWLDLPEAPHRGYDSAPALFGAVHAGDTIGPAVASGLAELAARLRPDLVLAPQGLGNHVDHQIVVSAVQAGLPADRTLRYRDTPYAMRQPSGPSGTGERVVPIGGALDRKIAASCAYASQVGFQFGGAAALATALAAFAQWEGGGIASERVQGTAALPV